MNSRIYRGWVGHARIAPRAHAFRYRVFFMYLDLAELPELFESRLLWSARRPALAWFRREDHLGDPAVELDAAVRDLVADQSGRRPRGPVRLLTHLRYFGYCMNPVSFYYCFDETGKEVEHVVAEVSNTPWNERHCYVLSKRNETGSLHGEQFTFDKSFHVSPFMSMEQRYVWRLSAPGEELLVRMESFEANAHVFTASMRLREQPLTGRTLAAALVRHPCMTLEVISAIYWQALRLWLKRTPFHTHPKHVHAREVNR